MDDNGWVNEGKNVDVDGMACRMTRVGFGEVLESASQMTQPSESGMNWVGRQRFFLCHNKSYISQWKTRQW